jgi:uncharacterized repeat protein (TIGR04138 family)
MPNETPTEPTSEERRSFAEGLDEVLREDARYAREAYVLVMEALAFTCRDLEREGHVTGQELLEGLRKYVLQEYGPMARVTLSEWGIARGEDVGNIVFNLVNHRLLRKTDEDSIEDFAGGYDFHEAFEAPFEP